MTLNWQMRSLLLPGWRRGFFGLILGNGADQQPDASRKWDDRRQQYHDDGNKPGLTFLFVGPIGQNVGPSIKDTPHHDPTRNDDAGAERDQGVDRLLRLA